MKIAVLGGNGQLGKELRIVSEGSVHQFEFYSSKECDVTNSNAVNSVLTAFNPDVVVNASAYTAVDKAESDRVAAFAVNEQGASNIANVCRSIGCRLIHVSTDFVFSGNRCTPYTHTDLKDPLSVYGKSKAAGEEAILDIWGSRSAIVRTSWLYSFHSPCFVQTMLRLMNERDSLSVVADQLGSPTSVATLAEWLLFACLQEFSGVYHVSDAGVASWYDFAHSIYELGRKLNLITSACALSAIKTVQYPTPAERPKYSVLDCSGSFCLEGAPNQMHWREALFAQLVRMSH